MFFCEKSHWPFFDEEWIVPNVVSLITLLKALELKFNRRSISSVIMLPIMGSNSWNKEIQSEDVSLLQNKNRELAGYVE